MWGFLIEGVLIDLVTYGLDSLFRAPPKSRKAPFPIAENHFGYGGCSMLLFGELIKSFVLVCFVVFLQSFVGLFHGMGLANRVSFCFIYDIASKKIEQDY